MSVILRDLAQWRRLVAIVAEAVKYVRLNAEVYVIGGAAEGRLTILSDIDVVIALPHEPSHEEAVTLIEEIFKEAEEHGLPLHAPIELHVVGPQELQKLLKKGKALRIDKEKQENANVDS